jgi:beta-phosphoglucomutase-like phosphatase (HAD superfamily)
VSYTHLLFDHDGVLVNTEPLYLQAIQEQLAKLGIVLSEAEYLKGMAYGADPWALARETGCDETAIDDLRDARDACYQQLLQTQSIEIVGADAVIAELARHFTLAIVTTSRDVDFDLIHGLNGYPLTERTPRIVEHMDFVLKRSHYQNSKPDPEPYLLALHRFGIEAAQALVIEDSERGLRSAVAAGIDCAVVDHPFTASQHFDRARYRFPDLKALKAFLLHQ